jgi:hypothetical protein
LEEGASAPVAQIKTKVRRVIGPQISYAGLIDENAALDHGRFRKIIAWRQQMANDKGPNIKKKQKCKNCEGKGLLKKGDKVVKCQRCGGTGVR